LTVIKFNYFFHIYLAYNKPEEIYTIVFSSAWRR